MWYVLEGLDRTGKSSVSEYYATKGFEIVHLSAPNKKYSVSGYVGPSYLDEMVDLLMSKDGQDVVWDRSWYGEMIWPHVYGREPQLSEDDLEVIREFEERNQTAHILMIDPNVEAHWKRCVDNKEPMNRVQFEKARQLYSKMAHTYNFAVTSLPQFLEHTPDATTTKNPPVVTTTPPSNPNPPSSVSVKAVVDSPGKPKITPEQEKLERANAINSILKLKRIFKQEMWPYNELETGVRHYLNDQLGDLLGLQKQAQSLTKEDIQIVKEFVKRLKDKQGVK